MSLGAAVGAMIGAASFRAGLRGSYFALVTLAFAEVFRVLSNSLDCDQALFIKQKIERALGIKDRAMAGEVPR